MIKINLLPPSVFEKEVVRRLIMLFGMLLALIIAGGFGYRMSLNKALADKQQLLQETRIVEQQAVQTKQQAEAEKAKIAPIQTKVSFIKGVMDYNKRAPDLYEELARWTYEKIRYKSITLTDTDMTIEAHAPSLSDAGRYLLNLYRATHVFSQVSMDAVPQFDSKAVAPPIDLDSMAKAINDLQSDPQKMAAVQKRFANLGPQEAAKAFLSLVRAKAPKRSTAFDFKVTCKLAQPLAAPAYGAGGAAPTGTAAQVAAPAGGAAPGYTPAPTPAAAPAGGVESCRHSRRRQLYTRATTMNRGTLLAVRVVILMECVPDFR